MVWTTATSVKLITGLTTSDIGDTDLDSLIELAQKEVLLQTNQKVIREPVVYLDETRENLIDGDNTTYYISNWKGNYLSDSDFDLDIDTSDVDVYSVASDGTETSLTVSSITYDEGKIVLASAPDNVDLYITYSFNYFDPSTPDPLLKLATEYLAGAYAYMRIDSKNKKTVKFGNTSTTNFSQKESTYHFLYNKYLELIKQLNDGVTGGAIWGISKVLI